MQRASQVAGLLFFAVGIFAMSEGRSLESYDTRDLSSGFFPFWLGAIMTGLSVIWLGQLLVRPPKVTTGNRLLPTQAGAVRVVSILLSIALFDLMIDVTGFQLTALAFLSFLLFALGRQNPFVVIAVSVAGSFGLYHLFHAWLGVPLPTSSIELLQNLGL